MAMSADRGKSHDADVGYGLVCDLCGRPYPDLIVGAVNQEHGIVRVRKGSRHAAPHLPVGARVRILPNHACATAASFDEYVVLDGTGHPTERWPRFRGW